MGSFNSKAAVMTDATSGISEATVEVQCARGCEGEGSLLLSK